MKNKLAIIDLYCPIGHFNFIKFYIDNLKNKQTEVILNEKIFNFLKYKNVTYCKLDKFFHSLIYSIKIVYILKKKKVEKALFLSYDHRTYFITSYLLGLIGIKNIIVEHDKIQNKISNFIYQKLISEKTLRLTFAYNIRKYSNKVLNIKNIFFINFPIIKDYKNYNLFFNNTVKLKIKKSNINVLVPTRYNLDIKFANRVINKYKNFIFYTFSKKINLPNSVFTKNVSSNDIKKFDFIFLPFQTKEYNLRVSSWIYKSLAYGKCVLINDGISYKFEKRRFVQSVFNSKNFKISVIKKKKRSNYNRYNYKCIEAIKFFLK